MELYRQLYIALLFFSPLTCYSESPINSDDGFISVIPKESLKPPYDKTRCGFIPYGPKSGPGSFSLHLDTVFIPKNIGQWVIGTVNVTAGADALSGTFNVVLNIWPYVMQFMFCDYEHVPGWCPVKKGQLLVLPLNKFLYSSYLLPGHYIGNATAVNENGVIVWQIGIECTIYKTGKEFPP